LIIRIHAKNVEVLMKHVLMTFLFILSSTVYARVQPHTKLVDLKYFGPVPLARYFKDSNKIKITRPISVQKESNSNWIFIYEAAGQRFQGRCLIITGNTSYFPPHRLPAPVIIKPGSVYSLESVSMSSAGNSAIITVSGGPSWPKSFELSCGNYEVNRSTTVEEFEDLFSNAFKIL
jgi:hypothetical protein